MQDRVRLLGCFCSTLMASAVRQLTTNLTLRSLASRCKSSMTGRRPCAPVPMTRTCTSTEYSPPLTAGVWPKRLARTSWTPFSSAGESHPPIDDNVVLAPGQPHQSTYTKLKVSDVNRLPHAFVWREAVPEPLGARRLACQRKRSSRGHYASARARAIALNRSPPRGCFLLRALVERERFVRRRRPHESRRIPTRLCRTPPVAVPVRLQQVKIPRSQSEGRHWVVPSRCFAGQEVFSRSRQGRMKRNERLRVTHG